MVLSRWCIWKQGALLIFALISSTCHRCVADNKQTPVTAPKEILENPSYWLMNPHSTSCNYYSMRTFKVENRQETPTTLVIRQNVKVSW